MVFVEVLVVWFVWGFVEVGIFGFVFYFWFVGVGCGVLVWMIFGFGGFIVEIMFFFEFVGWIF